MSIKKINVVVGAINASGEPELLPIEVECRQEAIDDGTHYDLADDIASDMGYEPKFRFDQNDPAWQTMAKHSQLGELPDPVTAGWLAAVSDAFHQARKTNDSHLATKMQEILLFLNAVEKARQGQAHVTHYERTATSDEMHEAICLAATVDLFQAEAGPNEGRWRWSQGSDISLRFFDDKESAAANAVETLFPEQDWAYQVGSRDTRLGYLEWALHSAEMQAENAPENQVEHQR